MEQRQEKEIGNVYSGGASYTSLPTEFGLGPVGTEKNLEHIMEILEQQGEKLECQL